MSTGRATVVGLGVIGGSIAIALKQGGWEVFGWDSDRSRLQEAAARDAIDHIGFEVDVDLTFVATPVPDIAAAVEQALTGTGFVTDVGSVKGGIVDLVRNERFIAGHPMAGSEKSGFAGVDPALFVGATWVLTPGADVSREAYTKVSEVIAGFGANVMTLDAAQHDEMVATISHVPHIAASALMNLALRGRSDHDAVLRLAAGGFRDMTRIAAGHPDLWSDISLANSKAIIEKLRRLAADLENVAVLLERSDRPGLRGFLDTAAHARNELPLRSGRPSNLAVVRIPIPDMPGALGFVLGIFGAQHINVEDVDIAHDQKGDRGTLQVTIAQTGIESISEALRENALRYSVENL